MKSVKPKLRGYLHQEAFFASLSACVILMALSSNPRSMIANLVFSLGLWMLFGFSAIYHRPHWPPKTRALLKRVDHAAIFVLIASTSTPIGMFAIPEIDGKNFLVVIWSAAILGVLQTIFWIRSPKWLTAIFYVVMGWMCTPYFAELKAGLGPSSIFLLATGGVLYTLGAVLYAVKWPKLSPTIFGYHELFHLLTIAAAIMHFVVVFRLTT